MDSVDSTYRVHVICGNCKVEQALSIPKGKRIAVWLHQKQFIDKTLVCGFCGCSCLRTEESYGQFG